MPGFLLVLIGVRQRRPLFLLGGAVLLGLAVKRIERPRVARPGEAEARDASAWTEPEPPSAPEPPAAPEPAAAGDPDTPDATEPDQPESA